MELFWGCFAVGTGKTLGVGAEGIEAGLGAEVYSVTLILSLWDVSCVYGDAPSAEHMWL